MYQPPGVPGVPPVPQYPHGYALGRPGPNTLGATGVRGYGTQAQRAWAAGETDERQLLDIKPAEFVWRASVTGSNITLRLNYGGPGTITLDNLVLPFVAFVPGQFNVYARPTNPALPAAARPTLTAATGGIGTVRAFFTTGQALPEQVRRVVALGAATVTVNGTAVALVAAQELDVAAPSVVTAGDVIGEFTL